MSDYRPRLSIEITDEQITSSFEKDKQFYGEDANIEDYREIIKDQLYQQELSLKFNDWIAKLREDADITYYLSY